MSKFNRRQFVKSGAAALTLGVATARIGRAADDAWGDLTGRLIFDGPVPERKKLVVDKDVECCGQFDIRDESLLVGKEGGLQNVYIYLRGKAPAICPDVEKQVAEQVLLDNRNCIFVPHCMSIWVARQKYHIVNSDPVAQNVAFSPLLDKQANIVIPVGGDATWQFNRSQRQPVPIACNYHPWESAYILPLDHPYVAITAEDGSFTIPKLPAGELEFQVWHERTTYLESEQWPKGRMTTTIRAGVNDLGTIKLSPSAFQK
ncbi:MAG: cupredoxin domain-containing protein [Thermoguttaceae bacterium]